MATTCCPTLISDESSSSAIAILDAVSDEISLNDTAATAISRSDLEPLTEQLALVPSENTHLRLSILSTTCALVTISNSVSLLPTIIPVPLDVAS